jgi:hypothetical protein
MLVFLVDQTQQLCCALFQAVGAKLSSKRLLWEQMRVLFYDYALESRRQLLEALLYGLQKSPPTMVGKLCLHHEMRLPVTRHPVIADCASLFKRR